MAAYPLGPHNVLQCSHMFHRLASHRHQSRSDVYAVEAAAVHNELVTLQPVSLLAQRCASIRLSALPPACCPVVQDETDEAAQSALLTKWGNMHSVRTVLSMSAFAVMLAAVLRSRSSS
jgi:hypothetical protein